MSLTINEVFHVAAPPELVWRFLKDPARVVTHLPGAELLESLPDGAYRGRVRVKVGPVSTAYAGLARLVAVDDAARQMQLAGEGTEAGGAGSARLALTGSVAPAEGGCQVTVVATIDIAGKVMQFGRGMIDAVSRQLFRQFAESVQGALAVEAQGERVLSTLDDVSMAARERPAPVERELRLVPVLWRAVLDWLRRWLGRRR